MVSKRKTIRTLQEAIHDRNMDAIEDAQQWANVADTLAELQWRADFNWGLFVCASGMMAEVRLARLREQLGRERCGA